MKFRALQQLWSRRKESQKSRDAKRAALRARRVLSSAEGLEPRWLMATINYNVASPDDYLIDNPSALLDGDIDLMVRIANIRGTATLQLVDLEKPVAEQVVGSAALDEPIQIQITGYSTDVDGHTLEVPESLLIDLALPAGTIAGAQSITITLDGVDGTGTDLLLDDQVTIAPSGGNVYTTQDFNVTLNDGEKINVFGPVNAAGNVNLTANSGAIEVSSGGQITAAGDIALSVANAVTATAEADSLDALVMPSAAILINNATLAGANIALTATATANTTISATDLSDGQFSAGGIVAISSANVSVVGGSNIAATGALTINATTDLTTSVTRGAQDDGDSSDDDKDQDAAIAAQVITANSQVRISDGSTLTSGGATGITAANLINATTIADGTLSNGNAGGTDAGGTLATATVLGDTEVLVDRGATIASTGDLTINSNSNRNITTTSIATPGGAADDGDSSTTTKGQKALADNNASTSDGSVDLAAAIAINSVFGETRAVIDGANLSSASGVIGVTSSAGHNVQTIADGTTTTGENGTGVGIAVALGLNGVTDPNGATGLRSTARVTGSSQLDAAAVNVQALMPTGVFNIQAKAGASGPSKDENNQSTGADVSAAGALAIGVNITNSTAEIAPGATVTTKGGDFTFYASSSTNSTTKGLPNNPAAGDDLAIGAGIAISITDHTTRAALSDNAQLNGAHDASFTANSFHLVTTEGKAGATGGASIAAAVAYQQGNHDTLATVGLGSQLQTTGNVSVSAIHSGSNLAKADGNAEQGSDVAFGAAVSIDLLTDRTEAKLRRDVDAGGSVALNSVSTTTGASTAKASAKGENKNKDQNAANSPDQQGADQRAAGDSQASSRGARDSQSSGDLGDAKTSEGSLAIAAAIAFNQTKTLSRAAIDPGLNVKADGSVAVISTANADAIVAADGSASQSQNGVGAAVAINSATAQNYATIGQNSVITADGIAVKAYINDAIDTMQAESTSGAGAENVGVAGSLSINLARVHTLARIDAGTKLSLQDGSDEDSGNGSLVIEASSITDNQTRARSHAEGGDFGLGASIAFNIMDHDTRAELADDVVVYGVENLTVTATSKHDAVTFAEGGAAGGIALTPVATATLAFPTTVARLGTQSDATVVMGDVTVAAHHTSTIDADAAGKTEGEDAAIGLTLGFSYTDEQITATTARSLSADGDITILATSDTTHTTDAKASATGAAGNKDNQGGTVQDKSDGLRSTSNDKSQAHSGATSGTDNKATASTKDKNKDGQGDAITVAGAFAVNIVESDAIAEIPDGLSISAGGKLTVRAVQNGDANANADGSATNGDVGIGAAVAINVADISGQATVGASTIQSDGLAVESGMKSGFIGNKDEHTFSATAKSGAGGEDVGVAGSLSINHLEIDSQAIVKSGASIELADGSDAGSAIGPVSIVAESLTDTTSHALPQKPGEQAQGGDFGLGASVALTLSYGETRAEVEDGVSWSGGAASSVSVDALADHQFSTTAENGAASDEVAVGGAVAVVISKNHTTARLGSGGGSLLTSGDALIHASHTNHQETSVSSAATGESAAIGASVGVVIVEDTSTANLAQDLQASGNVTVKSQLEAYSQLDVQASAGGGSESDGTADEEASSNANQPNAQQNGSSNTVPSAEKTTTDANTKSSDESSSSGGGVGIAASVAVNALSLKNSASISQGADVTAGQTVSVSAPAHIQSLAKADSSAIDSEQDVSIGAAVSLNWVSLTNDARVGSGSVVDAKKILIEAVTTDAQTNDYRAQAFALAGNENSAAIAGVAALNVVDADTTALAEDNSQLLSDTTVDVIAEHEMRTQAAALAGAGSDGASVAAAVAINVLGLNETGESGGSNTIASVGNPQANGAGATVVASGDVTVSSRHSIELFPTVELPEKLIDLDLDGPKDGILNLELASVAVSGGGSTGDFAGAASAAINLWETTTHASLDHGASVSGDDVSVTATDTTTLNSVAGALSVSTGGVGLGLGLDLAIVHKDTRATVGAEADVTASGQVTIDATSTEHHFSIAATAGIGNDVGIAGSAGVAVIETTTKAEIADAESDAQGATITATDGVALTTNGTFTTRMIAGAAGAGGSAGVGVTNTTLVHNDVVESRVGAHATIQSQADVVVKADSTEELLTIAAAGAGAGTGAAAGSAVVNVLNETTRATVANSANLIATNGVKAGAPDFSVLANDQTTIVSVGGSLAAAGTGAGGIGADVGTISKTTEASIGSGVDATIEGDLFVKANSNEDLTSVAAGMAFAGTAAISLDASVHVMNMTTRAFIGDEPFDGVSYAGSGDIHASGNIVVDANDQTEADKIVGVIVASGTAGLAAGAGVSTVTKKTEAFLGQGAKVVADGQTSTVSVPTGEFTIGEGSKLKETKGVQANSTATMNAQVGDLSAQGEIELPSLGDTGVGTDSKGNSNKKDASLDAQRTVTPALRSGFRGVSVTATNRDDIENYSVSLAGSGVALAISAGVNVIAAETRAYVGQNALVNDDQSAAHADQEVNVKAASDFGHVSFAGALAVGGYAGIAPAADITVLNNATEAYVGWDDFNEQTGPATARARKDVTVAARGTEDILLVGVGVGAAAGAGIGAGVDVLSFNNRTNAAIGDGSTVFAGGDVAVLSKDDTDVDVISGGGGGGIVGIGASVGVLTLNKDTNAWIGDGAQVDGRGGDDALAGVYTGNVVGDGDSFQTTNAHGVIVQADSNEDVLHLAIALGAGFVGAAGGITVTMIDSDTTAEIGDHALINQTNNHLASSQQSVYVNAANEARVVTFAGAAAGGAGAMAGAVDYGTLKNDIEAHVGTEAKVAAQKDVEVNGLGIKDLDDYTFSGAAGAVALAGAVSIWSVGTPIRKDYHDSTGKPSNAGQADDGPAADEDALAQSDKGRGGITEGLATFQEGKSSNPKANSRRLADITDMASSIFRSEEGAPTGSKLQETLNGLDATSGTKAIVDEFAEITAGFDIDVEAHEDLEFDVAVGGFAGGLAGVGAAVGVLSVAANTIAYSGGTMTAGDEVDVRATLDEDVGNLALAGAGGFVGLGAAVVDMTDASTVSADVGSVVSASSIDVVADSNQKLGLETGQLAAGGLAAGASFTTLKKTGQTSAGVLGGAQIGQVPGKSVGGLNVLAHSTVDADNTTTAISFGGVAVSVNFADAEITPTATTKASIGFGANVLISGAADVNAVADQDVLAKVQSYTGGAVSIGASLATAKLEGDVQLNVGSAATLNAHSVNLGARLNHDGVAPTGDLVTAIAEAPAAVPDGFPLLGLVTGTGSKPLAVSSADVAITVGDDVTLGAKSSDVKVQAFGSHLANASAVAGSVGLAATVGLADAEASANGGTTIEMEGAVHAAGQLVVKSTAQNHATSYAEATSVAGLGVADAGADARAYASPNVWAKFEGNDKSTVGGSASVQTSADNLATAKGDGFNVGGIVGVGEVHTTAKTNGETMSVVATTLDVGSTQVTSNGVNTATAQGIGAAGGFFGAGQGVEATVESLPETTAKITGKVTSTGNTSILATSTNTPTASATSIELTFGAAEGGNSAQVTSKPVAKAQMSGAGVETDGALTIHATDVSNVSSTAAAAAVGGFVHGSGLATNVVAADVQASIMHGVHTANSASIQASETSTVSSVANGKSGGAASVAGGVVTNDVQNQVLAEIYQDVFVNYPASGSGNIDVFALDTTNVTGTADLAAGSVFGSSGSGAAFNNLENNVIARIADQAHAATTGNVRIKATEDATVHQAAVGVNVSGGSGMAGNVAVNTVANDVEAYIRNGTVHAGNNVLVQAYDDVALSVRGASDAGGGAVGEGGTVVVNTFENSTRAYVDENSSVIASGSGAGLAITQWDNQGVATNDTLSGLGVIAHSSVKPADDPDGPSGPMNPTMVVAHNVAGGFAGVNGISVTNVVDDRTDAFIASSTVNSEQKPGDEVLVRAHSEHPLHSYATGDTGGAGAAGGLSVRESILAQTRAFISTNDETGKDETFAPAVVYGQHVDVHAVSLDTIEVDAKGGVGGGFAFAGAMSIAEIAGATQAFVRGSEVTSKEELNIEAGAVAAIQGKVGTDVGGGAAAGGVIGFNSIANTVQAQVLGSHLEALEETNIIAVSDELIDLKSNAASGAGLAALAGTVMINTIETTTEATVASDQGQASQINVVPAPPVADLVLQYVNVKASDDANIINQQGAIAGGGLGGIGAAVEASNIRNRTVASVGPESAVNAAHDITIDAQADHDVSTTVTGLGAGLIGLSGQASFVTIGAPTANDLNAIMSEFFKTDENGNSLESQVNMGSANQDLTDAISDKPGSASSLISDRASDRVKDLDSKSVQAQLQGAQGVRETAAAVENASSAATGSSLAAGGEIYINADHEYGLSQLVGSETYGLGAFGASITIANVRNDTRAVFGDHNHLKANGDLRINANDASRAETPLVVLAQGQQGGFGSFDLNLAQITVDADPVARIGAGAVVEMADDVLVAANQTSTVDAKAKGFALSGVAAAGSVQVTPTIDPDASASIGDGAVIGMLRSVRTLEVSSDAFNDVTNEAYVGKASAGVSSGHGTATTNVTPTVHATIGDADVKVLETTHVLTYTMTDVDSKVEALAIAAIADGAGKSTVVIDGEVVSQVNDGATIETDSLLVATGQTATADSHGEAIGGGLGSDIASLGTIEIAMDVIARVGDATITADGDVTLNAYSTSTGNATGGAVGVTAFGAGGTEAGVEITGAVEAVVEPGAVVHSGGDVGLFANATNTANAAGQTTEVGFAAGNAAIAHTRIDVDVLAESDNAELVADRTLRVEADSTNKADSITDGDTYSGVYAEGHIDSHAIVEGSTRAKASGKAHSNNAFVRVQATDDGSHAFADTSAANGGIGVTNQKTFAHAFIEPSADDGEESVRARLAGDVFGAGGVAVRAHVLNSYATANADGLTLAGAFATAGTEADSRLAQQVRASIGNDAFVKTGPGLDVKVEALNEAGLSSATARSTAGSLIAGATGSVANAEALNSAAAVVGDATIEAGGALRVASDAVNRAYSSCDGFVIGGFAGIGDVAAHSTAGDKTTSSTAEVLGGATITADSLDIDANGTSRAFTYVVGTSAGAYSETGAVADTKVTNAVDATIGDNTSITVTGDAVIHVQANSEGDAEAEGNSFGIVGNASDSLATVVINPSAKATLGYDSSIDAGGKIDIQAESNPNVPVGAAPSFSAKSEDEKAKSSVTPNDGFSQARATGSAGSGFIGINGTTATTTMKPVVLVTIEGSSSSGPANLSADGDIVLKTNSATNIDAQTANDAVGIFGAGSGQSTAGTVTDVVSKVIIGEDAELVAGGNLDAQANSRHVGHAEANATAFGAIGLSSSDSYVDVDYFTKVIVENGAVLTAGDELNLNASTNSYGDADAAANGAAGLDCETSANDLAEDDNNPSNEDDLEIGKARRGVRVGHDHGLTQTSVGVNAQLHARDIELTATIARSEGHSSSTADTFGAAGDSDALARVELWDDADVTVSGGAYLDGKDHVLLQAKVDEIDVGVFASASSVGIFVGASATIIADVDNDATVNVFDNSLIKTHALEVKALLDTSDVDFPDLDPEKDNHKGSLNASRVITFDGDVVLTTGPAILVVGLGGVAVQQENINYHLAGGNVVVEDIVNDDPGSVVFEATPYSDAPDSLIRSESMVAARALDQPITHGVGPTLIFQETFDSVTIENFSQFGLVINDVNVVNKNAQPEVTITAESMSQPFFTQNGLVEKEVFGFDVKHTFDATQITIADTNAAMPGDILLDGVIDNPIGTTSIANGNGKVANFADNTSSVVRTNQLQVESQGPVGSSVAPLKVELVASQNRPVDLDIASGGDVTLDLRGVVRQAGVTNFTFDASEISGDDVTVTVREAVRQSTLDNGVSYLVDVTETYPTTQTTPVENRFRVPNPPLASLTTMDLGIFGVTSVAIDSTYDFDQIDASGNVVLSGPAVGKKTSIVADTDLTGLGKIDVSGNGLIDVTETAGSLRAGALTSTGGDVILTALNGDIIDAANDAAADVSGNNVTLNAVQGAIGSSANALEINSSVAAAGQVHANAKLDIVATETSGALNAGVIGSATGHVTLTTNAGSIVDAHNDTPVNISGKNVTLDANGGASAELGETADALEVCVTGVGTFTADGAIKNVKNVCGPLQLAFAQSGLGTVSIASSGKLSLVDSGQVLAASNIMLASDGDLSLAPTSQITSTSGQVTVNAAGVGAGIPSGNPNVTVETGGVIQATRFDIFTGTGNDQILLKHKLTNKITQVSSSGGNDTIDGNFMVDRLFANGGQGNDTIFGGSNSDLLWGDAGNDQISGRGGNDAIVGGDGNDTLLGEAGRDLLFGGFGADQLQGGADDDFLLGGVFKLSENSTVLDSLLAAWGANKNYATRITNMRTLGVKAANILEDRATDQLTGGAGTDWFWDGVNDGSDRVAGEALR